MAEELWPGGMEYTFGNDADEEKAKLYRSLGVTSIESYVTWQTVEDKGKDQWDWSVWDKQVDILKRNNLKWVPFLIVGPAYSIPNWFRQTPDHFGCICLEHGTQSKVESLWNPNLPKWIERFIAEFAKKYRGENVIESVLLGIQGDYGEAIYSVTGGGWTFKGPGEYHNHQGFWCNDDYALADFRKYFSGKYRRISSLNKAWGAAFKAFDEIDFPARGEAFIEYRKKTASLGPEGRRRWLDFVEWYRGSMTRWSDWWIGLTRKYFPDTEIYLCTGGDAIPEHGSDFAQQCRVAAKHGAGVRITNEGSNYAANFVITRWVGSAGKFYNAYYGFEPAGAEDEKGIAVRIYNATASGARQLHDYNPNVIKSEQTISAQKANFKYIFAAKPTVDAALWYPNVSLTLDWQGFFEKASALRDVLDYDYVDETMLRDGALKKYSILIMLHGAVLEDADIRTIREWVKDGGALAALDFGPLETVGGDKKYHKRTFKLSGGTKSIGEGKTLYVPVKWENRQEFFDKLSRLIEKEGLINPDGEADGVYATVLDKNRVLYLNTTNDPVKKKIMLPDGRKVKAKVPPNAITEIVF